MRTFTRIALPALAAIAALGTAGAASAQSYGAYGHDRDGFHDIRHDDRYGNSARAEAIRNQLAQIEQRINRNDNRNRISEREAFGLRREVRAVREQLRYFNRDGLNNREFRILQDRVDRVRARLQVERNDRDGRRW